jgi:hypothetical protein
VGAGELLVLQYHSNDKYATPATEARVKDYKVKGFPTLMFDGITPVMGGSTGSYNQQSTTISKELAKRAVIGLTITSKSDGTSSVSVANLSGAGISNAKLMAVVYQDLGTDEHHFVVREILPPVVLSMAPGAQQSFDFKSTYEGANLNTVTFVQAGNGEVLQAAAAANP